MRRNLKQIQARFLGFVSRPLTHDYRLAPLPKRGKVSSSSLRKLVKPNDRLTSEERLELYARQYWFRLIDSLIEDFPGTRAVLGEKQFDQLVEAYITTHPSRSYTLRNLGDRFPEYLAKQKGLKKSRGCAAIEMSRLEWAKIEAFDAAEYPKANTDKINAEKLILQPHLHLLQLKYPVDEWLVKLNREEWRAEASNAVAGDRKQSVNKKNGAPSFRKKDVCVVVHRHQFKPYFKRIEKEAFELLGELQQGRSLEKSLAKIMKKYPHSTIWWQKKVQPWFAEWTALGWFAELPYEK